MPTPEANEARRDGLKKQIIPFLAQYYNLEESAISDDFILRPNETHFYPFDELAMNVFFRPINVPKREGLTLGQFIDLLLQKGFQ